MSCYSNDLCYCSICPAVFQLWNFVLTTPSQEFIFLTLENRASDYDSTLGYNCATKPNPRSIMAGTGGTKDRNQRPHPPNRG